MKNWSIINDKSIFLLLLCTFLICATGLSVDSVQWRTTGENSSWVSAFQSFLFIIGLLVAISGYSIYKDHILSSAVAFCSICFFCSLIHMSEFNVRSFIVMSFNVFAPALGLLFGKYLMMHFRSFKRDTLLLLLMQIPTFTVGYILGNINGRFDSDCSFAFFIFMPFVFFFRSNFLKLIFLVLYGILVLLAGKRSVSIAYTISVAIYLFDYFVIKRNHKRGDSINKAVFLIVSIVSFVFLIQYFAPQLETIVNRFQLIEDDGGSGRNEIYKLIIDSIYRVDIFRFLFGHGYYSVVNDFTIGAHNDFLEILYDYGFLAVFMYVILLIRIVAQWFRSIKSNESIRDTSYILLINIVFIVVLGMLNCMITSTYFNYLNYIALGATIMSSNSRPKTISI